MNPIAERIFQQKSVNLQKLVGYGFKKRGGEYEYRTPICDGEMILIVTVNGAGVADAEVRDAETGDPYTLYLVDSAEGSFVGSVRSSCEEELIKIANACFESSLYGGFARDVIEYVREQYGDELEFLWDDDNAVWRRKDNNKWYGALLRVSRRKLGLDSDEKTDIIDLRMTPEDLDRCADGKTYFRGYHMNKKHWVTICLDGTVEKSEIFRRIDESYLLAKK